MSIPHDGPDKAVVERFPPTSGRLTGILGLVMAGGIAVVSLIDWNTGGSLAALIIALTGGVLVWATLLRPDVSVTKQDLVLRGILHTTWIPLATIDTVVTTQVLAVMVDGKRYVSPAVGYPVRQVVKRRFQEHGASVAPHGHAAAFVESRITHLAQEARERGEPAGAVRRSWAWLEIGALVVLVLAFVVWLVA